MEDLQPALQLPNKKSNQTLIWVLAVLLGLSLIANGVLAWQWYDLNQKNTTLQNNNLELESQISELSEQLASAKINATDLPAVACDPAVTAELKANIEAAVSSGNYAALEGYMADTVTVILAASEGIGPRTPTEAVADMAYLNGGANPWNFEVDAATIATWDAGFYTDYFDDNTYVGLAANGMVVVFDFNDCGEISEVFMVANQELL